MRILCPNGTHSLSCDAGEKSQYANIFYHAGVDVELTCPTTMSDTVPINYNQLQEELKAWYITHAS